MYANLVNQPVANKEETFQRIRDFVCKRNGTFDYSLTGIGWTLHDSFYAVDEDTLTVNDYVVFKSTGESGKADIYVQMKYVSTASNLMILPYLYWDNVAHTGVKAVNTVNNFRAEESLPSSLYIYGDLDFIYLIDSTNAGTSWYCCPFGYVTDTIYDSTIAISAGAVPAGTDVTITLDVVPSSWAVGKTLLIRDNANIERVTILSISGLDITANVSNNYSANCKLAREYVIWASIQTNFGGSAHWLIGHDNLIPSVNTPVTASTIQNYADPDPLEGDFMASPCPVAAATSGYMGFLPNILIGGSVLANNGVYTTATGDSYRRLNIYSNNYLLFKEV